MRFRLTKALIVAAVVSTLLPQASAKPKFKILQTIEGGLFNGLTFDVQGNLYGATGGGGTGAGTIFELSHGAHGWKLTTIHTFDGEDGGTPSGELIFDTVGNLYGTSPSGGAYNDAGNVFEMTPGANGWTFSVLYNFCMVYHCPDGADPSGLVMDGSGNLYGAAGGGDEEGVVYELTPGDEGWTESVLHIFNGDNKNSGIGPSGPLVLDAAGNLYGTTATRNIYQSGTVFRLKHRADGKWGFKSLFEFNGTDGLSPYYGVVFDTSGNLYGTTVAGGPGAGGTVFKLMPTPKGRWKRTLLYDFPNPANGQFPTSGVTFDQAGNLYGTATGGNPSCSGGCGIVYELSPTVHGKWKYRVLHEFNGADGFGPGGGLILDAGGNLYGTAYSVVFEITP
jgi:uncharacterized repeat protein (TIGR03803 family)